MVLIMPRIHKTAVFSVIPHSPSNGLDRLHLLLQGQPTGRHIKGQSLLDQYRLGQRYLLISGDNTLYQEVLYIFLLDKELNTIDEAQLHQPYSSGVYHPVKRDHEHIKFQFHGDGMWCLSIREQPLGRVLNSDRFPVARPLKLWGKQYLNIERIAQHPSVA